MTDEKKVIRRTQRSSRLSTIVSISLVLFLLGVLSLLLLHARKLSDYVRENIEVSVTINSDTDPEAAEQLLKKIQSDKRIKSARLISKEEAAAMLQKELGDDFVSFLGYNPLYSSIDIRLKAEFADETNFQQFLANIKKDTAVQEVYYQPSLIESINRNLRTITYILLTFSALLVIVSITLINNTIRITLFARRMLIKSMLLVGATKGFIRKPFIIISIWNGIAGAVVAMLFLAALMQFTAVKIPELAVITDYRIIGTVAGGLLLTGIFLSFTCTLFAVNKYLRYRTENVY